MMEGAPEDEETERFFAAAGRCITGWAFIDRLLYDAFEIALGTDPVKASIVYYRSPSFGEHLTLTDKIITATLPDGSAERKEWSALKKRIGTLSPVRNQIAHHPVTVFSEASSRGFRAWLAYVEEPRKTPSLDFPTRFDRNAAGQINTAALVKHHSETAGLRDDLAAFLERAADALRKPAPEPT